MVEKEEARKFLFDLAFDNGMNKQADVREKPKPTFSEEQLNEAKQLSFEQGYAAGQKAMMEDQQQYMNVLLSQLDQKIGHVLETSTSIWQKQLEQCQQIALVIARKIVPNYVKNHGLNEIEAIVEKVLTEMSREPRLVFRVNEEQFDAANERINEIANKAAYAGKLVILGDPDLGPSDCRIEWADGGIERDLKTLWQDIDRVLEEVQTLDIDLGKEIAAAASQPDQNAVQTPETTIQQPSPEAGENQ